jgi:hypothetical protein
MGTCKPVVTTVAFTCRRCVRAGVVSPPTLAVVGDPRLEGDDFCPLADDELPAVLVRVPRPNLGAAAERNAQREPFGVDEFMIMKRLLPHASLEPVTITNPSESLVRAVPVVNGTVQSDIFRPPFRPLQGGRAIVECFRHHRVTVSRNQLVRLAKQANLAGDRFPTL